jgi:tRNA A37 threonylcarbamoyladenosine biosynthesis protein TsaE
MSIFNFFPDSLTEGQKSVISEIQAFLQDEIHQVLLLNGYAGTGKTFIMSGLVKYLDHQRKTVNIMAPTGRAALVISEKTGNDASTIHKAIYNMDELKEEESTFRLYFDLKENRDSFTTLYIVDEASMISDFLSEDEFFVFGSGHLLSDFFTFIDPMERPKAKVLFIGDNAQLPPIDMSYSPALDQEYLREKFKVNVKELKLKEVVRQKADSAVLTASQTLRQALEQKCFNSFQITEDKREVFTVKPQNFLKDYLAVAGNTPNPNAIVITHSNRQALEYNLSLRSYYFPNHPGSIRPGDVLILTKNNYNYKVDLFNGMFVKVLEIEDNTESITTTFIVKGGKKVTITHHFRNIVVEVPGQKGERIHIKCKVLDNFLFKENAKMSSYEQRAFYVDFKNRMANKGIKSNTSLFKDALKEDKYFNAIQAKFGYAITCHKSQGGEWSDVFVDFKVMMGKSSSGFFRWAYTAITRTRSKLYLIDAPAYSPLTEFVVGDILRLNGFVDNYQYLPPVIIEGADPEVFKTFPFLKSRYSNICDIMKDQQIEVKLEHKQYCERYAFSKNGEFVMMDIWYGKKFFNGKQNILSKSSDTFEHLILDLIADDHKSTVPFPGGQQFQHDLYNYLYELLLDNDVIITNIVCEQWCDRYFVKTDGECAVLEFWYGLKNIYTKVIPKSTLGIEDKKLNKVLSILKGQEDLVIV